MKILTRKQLENLKGYYLDVYPLHYHTKDVNGKFITVYELRGKSKIIQENFESVEEILNL
jgi:penicillin V acylase-like amidase (Ntn superfamily)